MRQAQAAGRLHHPHIVTVFDAGHVNRIGYIALEKVDGKLLDELLAEGYRPGFLQAADIVARVADAVEFATCRVLFRMGTCRRRASTCRGRSARRKSWVSAAGSTAA